MNALSLFNDWLNNDFYGSEGLCKSRASLPDVDVTESKEAYVLDMDLPGRTEKDINLEINDGVLTISSVKEEVKTNEEKKGKQANAEEEKPLFLLRERCRSEFRRSFSLPKDIDTESVSAGFKNGVLSIKIPRKAEVAPRKIQISVA